MEYIIGLFTLAVGFYFYLRIQSHMQQYRQQQTATVFKRPAANVKKVQQIPTLVGIEISPAQQRRLGQEDPSVQALQGKKPIEAYTRFADPTAVRSKNKATELNNFFKQLFDHEK